MLRRWRSRFGISAPRVAVRTHVPWYWWGGSALAILAVTVAVAGWMYDAGRRFAGFDRDASEQELIVWQTRTVELEKEVARLRSLADAGESRLQIERAAQQQLARQVKVLEEDNARIKDDLAVFESLAQAEGQGDSLSINRLRVESESNSANQYRYRMLLAMQGNSKEREFKGNLQLALSLRQDGQTAMLLLPLATEANAPQYRINFKHFRRLDGVFAAPAGARIERVEVRLLQDGVLKASKSVSL